MKYAVISDIHGNIFALKRALDLIDQENVDKIICLGDIIGIGTRSDECVKLLFSYEEKLICVKGNHEDRFLYGVPEYIHEGKYKMTEEDISQEHWIRDHISDESKKYLEKLKSELVIELDGVKCAITHYPLDDNMNYEHFIDAPQMEDLFEFFKKYNATINFYGHTHNERIKVAKDGTWFINPGTLGTTDFKNFGTYGILQIDDNKNIAFVTKAFNYDLKAALDDFDVMNPPRKNHFRDKFFGYKR
jgi:putative phosphoesterase